MGSPGGYATGAFPVFAVRQERPNPSLYKKPQPSGRVQIQPPMIAAAAIGASDHGQGAKIRPITMLSAKAQLAATLPLRLIAPFSRQRRMCGPKVG